MLWLLHVTSGCRPPLSPLWFLSYAVIIFDMSAPSITTPISPVVLPWLPKRRVGVIFSPPLLLSPQIRSLPVSRCPRHRCQVPRWQRTSRHRRGPSSRPILSLRLVRQGSGEPRVKALLGANVSLFNLFQTAEARGGWESGESRSWLPLLPSTPASERLGQQQTAGE